MLGSVSIVTFVAIFVVIMALIYAFSGGSVIMTERLGRLWQPPSQPRKGGLKESRKQAAAATLDWLSRIFPSSPEQAAKADPRLVQAGFRRPESASAFRAAKVITILTLVTIVFLSGLWRGSPVIYFLIAVVLGFMLPDMWLSRKVKARQQALRLALPDALDLLVICMEAGLGLDQALLYVGQELRIAHPELCEEFDLVNAEMQMGRTRLDALRSLSTRAGVEDIQGLVATLIQTDRFGTSVSQSLRIHSDDLRTKRRQRAEEAAAKTTIKMLFPLVFFVFPALFVVIMGPAVIRLYHMFVEPK
jgi:tight adherence protein C